MHETMYNLHINGSNLPVNGTLLVAGGANERE